MPGPLAAVMGFLRSRVDRDGQAPALESQAALFEPSGDADGSSRRDRGFARPQEILEDSLALKVLDGWLQNRHQILVPLAFRLDRLPEDDMLLLMRFAAAVLRDASSADETAIAAAERWLSTVQAGPAGVAAFRADIATPAPLSTLMSEVSGRGLEPYAYAAAVAIADTRDAAGHLYANYVAARLALPADAIRSIDRRFRR